MYPRLLLAPVLQLHNVFLLAYVPAGILMPFFWTSRIRYSSFTGAWAVVLDVN